MSPIGLLREELSVLTNVLPKRQKIIGLPGLKPNVPDEFPLVQAGLKHKHKLMMVGACEAQIFVDLSGGVGDDVKDDFDDDYALDEIASRESEEAQKQLAVYTDRLKINIISAPRPGKKLLVLDLDYTLFDMKSQATNFDQLKRPFTGMCRAMSTAV